MFWKIVYFIVVNNHFRLVKTVFSDLSNMLKTADQYFSVSILVLRASSQSVIGWSRILL